MPGKGRKFTFYGAFGSKAKARKAERRHKHSFIRTASVKGHKRYIVMKAR